MSEATRVPPAPVPEATPPPDLNAVIFSGGGADGAYQVGVAQALFNGKSPSTGGKPLDPEVFTGTSVGSFNASFLVSQWADYGASAVGHLEKVWLERMAWTGAVNGGFRVRFNPFELLDPGAYLRAPLRFEPLRHLATDLGVLGWEGLNRAYNLAASNEPLLGRLADFFNLSSFVAVEPWERTIRESIDFKKLRNSPKRLRIAATNWAFGEVREFLNRDMTDKLGPAAIRASSAVPGVYPPAQVGAQSYVDGAVLMNTPLKPAIKELIKYWEQEVPTPQPIRDMRNPKPANFTLHVIYMNTDVEKMPIDALNSTLQSLYRTQIIGWAATVNQDIKRARLINRAMLENLSDPELFQKDPMGAPVQFKPLTIHRYFPPDGLDGALGFLDVRRPRLERLINEGFDNTVNHDCAANKCIIVPRVK